MKITSIFSVGAASLMLMACTTNPITGRKSVQIGSLNSQIQASAVQQYKETLASSKVISGTTAANQIKTVGNNIKNAANKYYTSIGRAGSLEGYSWEFNLLQSDQVNAWCMPGGKVAVYSGILPVTKDANGMAVVMGHEISHALAGHGNERISQAVIAQYGGQILGGALSSSQWSNIFQQAYPLGAQAVLLKYGRSQELEADEMGLYLMSMAGYDPRTAAPFWERMESISSGNRPPEFLSTHPSPENRRADINKHLPRALEYYKAAGGKI